MIPLFGQGAFQSSANMTPQQIERKRALMAALMPRFGSAKYVGEGLGQLATGVAMGRQSKQLDQRENANRQEGDNLFQRILSGASSRQPQGGGTGFSILGQTPSAGQAVANDTMAALGKSPMGQPSTISQSLARTESGGDYNVVNSEGYTGKYQWGQARLDDFNRANGTSYKVEDLRGNPQLTEATQAWHEKDILNELGGYVGRVVNGIPMTEGAIVAMAHLGGKGGARRFIESGGEYNPADSNGTSLADYARTHNGASRSGQTQQVQQGGDIPLENLYSAMASPLLTEEQRSVITQMIQQREQAADPMRQMEMERAQLELEQLRNPQPDLTSTQREYEMARAQGFEGSFLDYKTALAEAGRAQTTINNDLGGVPSDDPLRKKLMEGEGTTWSNYLSAGNTSAGMRQDMELLNEVIEMAPQGPISGRIAQAFPGISDAAGVFQSVVKRVAPSLRVEGSGSQSDIEYNGFLQSMPSLVNRPEANRAIASVLQSKAQINMDRALVVSQYQNGEIEAPEARRRIAEIDQRSIMTPEIQAMLGSLDGGEGAPAEAVPEGIDPADWEYMSPEERALFQ